MDVSALWRRVKGHVLFTTLCSHSPNALLFDSFVACGGCRVCYSNADCFSVLTLWGMQKSLNGINQRLPAFGLMQKPKSVVSKTLMRNYFLKLINTQIVIAHLPVMLTYLQRLGFNLTKTTSMHLFLHIQY